MKRFIFAIVCFVISVIAPVTSVAQDGFLIGGRTPNKSVWDDNMTPELMIGCSSNHHLLYTIFGLSYDWNNEWNQDERRWKKADVVNTIRFGVGYSYMFDIASYSNGSFLSYSPSVELSYNCAVKNEYTPDADFLRSSLTAVGFTGCVSERLSIGLDIVNIEWLVDLRDEDEWGYRKYKFQMSISPRVRICILIGE